MGTEQTSGWDRDLIYAATRTGRKAHIAIGAGATFCGARTAVRVAAAWIDAGRYHVCATCEHAVESMNRRAAENGRAVCTIAAAERKVA